MICPICGRLCQYAEGTIEIVTNLLLDGYARNYTILCVKVGEGKFKAAKKLYRVDFAHPKRKHIILISPRSDKTNATRATRLAQKEIDLKKSGWKISKLSSIPCR